MLISCMINKIKLIKIAIKRCWSSFFQYLQWIYIVILYLYSQKRDNYWHPVKLKAWADLVLTLQNCIYLLFIFALTLHFQGFMERKGCVRFSMNYTIQFWMSVCMFVFPRKLFLEWTDYILIFREGFSSPALK